MAHGTAMMSLRSFQRACMARDTGSSSVLGCDGHRAVLTRWSCLCISPTRELWKHGCRATKRPWCRRCAFYFQQRERPALFVLELKRSGSDTEDCVCIGDTAGFVCWVRTPTAWPMRSVWTEHVDASLNVPLHFARRGKSPNVCAANAKLVCVRGVQCPREMAVYSVSCCSWQT